MHMYATVAEFHHGIHITLCVFGAVSRQHVHQCGASVAAAFVAEPRHAQPNLQIRMGERLATCMTLFQTHPIHT